MKKHLIAAAVAGVFAGPAMAQVTVGGNLDTSYVSKTGAIPVSASATYNSNGSRSATATETATISAVDNAFWSTSQINFKGSEDLGGGLKAEFHVEGAVLTDTGSANLADRVSKISVSGAFGTVSLGREGTAVNDASSAHGLGNFANLPITTAGRPNNAVNYTTPSFNGFNARVTVGQGESEKDDKANDYSAVSLHGKVGKFSFAVAQANQKDVRSASTGRAYLFNNSFNAANAGFTSVVTITADADSGVFGAHAAQGTLLPFGPASSGTWTTSTVLSLTQGIAAVNGKNRDTIAAAAYDFGVATVRVQHLRSKSSGNVSNGNGIQLVNRTINAVSLAAPMGAATVFLNYQEHDYSKDQRSSSTGAQNALSDAVPTRKSDVMAFGALYALSKRTSAYIVHRNVDNDAGANYISGISGKDAKSTAIGLRHSF